MAVQYRGSDQAGLEALVDLSFTRFITINIVKIIYVIGLVVVALIWLIGVITAFWQSVGAGLLALILLTIVAFLSLLLWRVYMELIIVVFRIEQNTAVIAGSVEPTRGFPVVPPPGAPPQAPPPPV